MTNIPLGKDGKLFLNTGTYAAPTWSEVVSVEDLSIETETSEAEVSRRGSGGFRQFKMTLRDVSTDVTFIKDKDDAHFKTIEGHMQAGTEFEAAVADGPDGTGTDWFLARWAVSSWNEGQELEEGMAVDATLRVVPGTTAEPVNPEFGNGPLPTTRPPA